MRTESGQNGSKLRLCTKAGTENLILYSINARMTTLAVFAHAQYQIRQKIAEANFAKTWSIRPKFTSKRKQVVQYDNKVVD